MAAFAEVFHGVARLYLIRKQGRECSADGVLLYRCLCEACGKNAELNRHYDFFLTGYTDGDYQISRNGAVRTYAQVSAVIVRCKSGFAG